VVVTASNEICLRLYMTCMIISFPTKQTFTFVFAETNRGDLPLEFESKTVLSNFPHLISKYLVVEFYFYISSFFIFNNECVISF
jgi:hypothetical protein